MQLPRFKITLQYDGSSYAGWQIQAEAATIQSTLEKCLEKFNNDLPVRVTGAGRTDAGVHAWGQVAHFDLETRLDSCDLKKAMNATLPEDIKIMELEAVPAKFHARYSAEKRLYRYQCYTGDNILMRNQTWMVDPFDLEIANKVAESIKGEHDFTSFAKKNPELKHYMCNIYDSEWKAKEGLLIYSVMGNRFLHHMVRYLTGTMVAIAQGRYSFDDFKDLLENPTENVTILKAPGQGLILKEVFYEE